MFKNIAILTTKSSWFVPYARKFVRGLKRHYSIHAKMFFRHEDVPAQYEVMFILSYFRLVGKEYLRKRRHNIVVHASDLPKGTGWAPFFWQVLENKNKIPFVLFEATERADAGKIYLKANLRLKGDELNYEMREMQAKLTTEMCWKFLTDYKSLRSHGQRGLRTYYRRRTPEDSQLDLDAPLRDQFNLLRTVSNEDFPAFFYHRCHKYILHIYKAPEEETGNLLAKPE
jgi:methionyl-tRNA formyltransferase